MSGTLSYPWKVPSSDPDSVAAGQKAARPSQNAKSQHPLQHARLQIPAFLGPPGSTTEPTGDSARSASRITESLGRGEPTT